MKSNKKHHGHVNPNSKQKQPNKQLNQPTNSQPNLALDANNTKPTNTASVAQDSKQTKIVTNNEDENLPVVSDDQTIANIINEENEEANKHVPLEPADDLTLQNKEKEKELLANQETNSTPVHKEVKINAIAKPKKLGIVIVEHNAQTKIKELMIAIESAQGFSNEDVNVYIWDDYSTDNTRAYVAGLSKRFEIHYILNENQEGVVCARNNMLNYVNDDYLIFVDYRDELVIPALTEFFQHYNKNDFMMLRRNIMHSMSKQIVDAGVYHDKGSKSATYLTRTPYSFVTGIFVAKSIYQKVRELINQNYEYAKDIRFYEDMVVYPFWVYYSKTPCFLDSYYNYNIMGHD
ncbi:glycosyltransferase [bacterium]|nr:glycosyltransferase [bacterium]